MEGPVMYSRLARTSTQAGRQVFETTARGYDVLRDPLLNKGIAFTLDERASLGLLGLLPNAEVADIAPQLDRAYAIYSAQPSDLAKHLYMMSLHDTNVTLFFALMQHHLLEMLPIVYDPVVGQAIKRFSQAFTRPRGVFLSIGKIDAIEDSLRAFGAGPDDIDLLVATDAEEILGIGDWGSNGVDIAIGKLAVYTAAAGIGPHRVIPVMLDGGTNRESLLNDPMYIGYRHARVRGAAYDAFVDAYVTAATKLFPKAMLHWEDFGSSTCRRVLDRHRDTVASFNDDMQGTGAITMSGLFNAVSVAGSTWPDQKIVIAGGVPAGCGIADQIRDAAPGGATPGDDDLLFGPGRSSDGHRIEQAGHRDGPGALHVVVKAGDGVAVPVEDPPARARPEVLPMQHGLGEELGGRRHVRVDEGVVGRSPNAGVPVADVHRVVEERLAVGTAVEHDRDHPVRVDSRGGGIHGQLADRDVDAIAAPVSDAEDLLRVGGHQQVNVVRAGAECAEAVLDGVDLADGQKDPARAGKRLAETLDGLPDHRVVHDREHLE